VAGLNASAAGTGGRTLSVADFDVPLVDALSDTVVATATPRVATENCAELLPTGTTTLLGSEPMASPPATTLRATLVSVPAGALSVTVPVTPWHPPAAVLAFRTSDDTPGAVTVSVAVFEVAPATAFTLSATLLATGTVVTANCAVEAPAAIVTPCGNVTTPDVAARITGRLDGQIRAARRAARCARDLH
jgi:hypothetical protein